MKTLGDLRTGDKCYILHYDGGYITDIEVHNIDIITEIKIGMLVKWFDDEKYVHARTIIKEDYCKTECTSGYCEFICSDLVRAQNLLTEDYNRFIKRYNSNLEKLNKVLTTNYYV